MTFDEWFLQNEHKYSYPRQAYRAAKDAWVQSEKSRTEVLQKKLDSLKDLCCSKRGDVHWLVDEFIGDVEEVLK